MSSSQPEYHGFFLFQPLEEKVVELEVELETRRAQADKPDKQTDKPAEKDKYKALAR